MIRLEDIRIPEMPDPTIIADATAHGPQLLIGGRVYELSFVQRNATIEQKVDMLAKNLVYSKLAELESYRNMLQRVYNQLQDTKRQMIIDVGMRVPTQRQAASGLRVWQNENEERDFSFEMPLLYHPQYIKVFGVTRQLAPGQFRPIHVSAVMRWSMPEKCAVSHALYYLNSGERFEHYHTNGSVDCVGDLPTDNLATYEDILKAFWEWGQQLTLINCDSIAIKHPAGMPHYTALRVIDNGKEVGWTTTETEAEIDRSHTRATQPF